MTDPARERKIQKDSIVIANKVADWISQAVRDAKGAVRASLETADPHTRSPWRLYQVHETVVVRVHVVMDDASEFLCKAADALYYDLASLPARPAESFTESVYLYVVREPAYQQYHTYRSERSSPLKAGLDTWTSVVDHYGAKAGFIDQASLYVVVAFDVLRTPRHLFDVIMRKAQGDGLGRVCWTQLPPGLADRILMYLVS